MNETEKTEASVKVNDRRRFDPDGQPREEQEPSVAADPENASAAQGEVQAAEPEPATVPASDFEEVRQQLEASRKRVDELARAYQALLKDREEYKARLSRERERMIDVEKGNVAQALLEAIDELDRCVGLGDDNSPLAQGVKLIRDGLLKKAQAIGIERLELEGKTFDPNLAEASDMEMTTDPDEDQKVLAVERGGYRLKDRVIRPARVKVAKYVKPADA
jgi:molecular chaperone GrpE